MDGKTASIISEKLALSDVESATLATFRSLFDAARDGGNVEDMRSVVNDEEFETLATKAEHDAAWKHIIVGRYKSGAISESTKVLGEVVLLTSSVLTMRRQAAQNVAIAKARIDALEARIAGLEQRLEPAPAESTAEETGVMQ